MGCHGADSSAFQPLSPFSDLAVSIRCNEDPEAQHLDGPDWNQEVAGLIKHVEELINE
jgi:hypothetical protein